MRRTQWQSAKNLEKNQSSETNVTICCAVSMEGLLQNRYSRWNAEGNLTNGTVQMDLAFLTMLPGIKESKIWTILEYSEEAPEVQPISNFD